MVLIHWHEFRSGMMWCLCLRKPRLLSNAKTDQNRLACKMPGTLKAATPFRHVIDRFCHHTVFMSKGLEWNSPRQNCQYVFNFHGELVYRCEIFNFRPVSFLLESQARLEDLTRRSQKAGFLNVGPPKWQIREKGGDKIIMKRMCK